MLLNQHFISYFVWNFHSYWLLILRVMQENKSGCFFWTQCTKIDAWHILRGFYQLLGFCTVAIRGDLQARSVETFDADNSSWRSPRATCRHSHSHSKLIVTVFITMHALQENWVFFSKRTSILLEHGIHVACTSPNSCSYSKLLMR